MNDNKSQEINDQVEYGLDTIDPNQTVKIKLKDLLLIYKTFEELNRFFHQDLHYPTIEDLHIYLGNRDAGAYSLISKILYHILGDYLPEDISSQWSEEGDPFSHPERPYYYQIKNDESIDDGTIEIKSREAFSKYVEGLLGNFKANKDQWENNTLENFLGGVSAYSKDIDGYYQHMAFDTSAETPTWRIFAQILKGASVYE